MGACGCLFLFSPSHSAKGGEEQMDHLCRDSFMGLGMYYSVVQISFIFLFCSGNIVVFHALKNYPEMIRDVSRFE